MHGPGWDMIALGAAWPPAWRLDGLALLFLVPALLLPAVAALYAPAYLAQARYRGERPRAFAWYPPAYLPEFPARRC